MTAMQQVITILVVVAATVMTRFLPYLIFSEKRPVSDTVRYRHYPDVGIMSIIPMF